MRVFMTRLFAKWAKRNGITERALLNATKEIQAGLVDAKLGDNIIRHTR
jgi:hypothetical protein